MSHFPFYLTTIIFLLSFLITYNINYYFILIYFNYRYVYNIGNFKFEVQCYMDISIPTKLYFAKKKYIYTLSNLQLATHKIVADFCDFLCSIIIFKAPRLYI